MSERVFTLNHPNRECAASVIQFKQRRFFPERQYRTPLRWVFWAALLLLFLVFVLFVKLFR